MSYTIRLLFLVSCVLISACKSSPNEESVGPYDGHYVVTQILTTKYPQEPARANIVGDVILGQGPVNQWSGGIVDKQVTGLQSTRRAGPAQNMQVESFLLNSLEGSQIKKKFGGNLEFEKNGKTVVWMEKIELIR